MCGIVGMAMLRGSVDPALLERCRDTLTHRGPDDAGLWLNKNHTVGLAHRRLSIIDLSPGGHQPMCNAAGQAIAFNGEIYNFQDLRNELAAQGCTFKSTSDTEILLEAWRQWGPHCLKKLDGMFAFAVYDPMRNALFLARDRAGEKPLFYFLHDGVLQFASELKAILENPAAPRRLDPEALNHYLAYGYVPGDLCMLKGFNKLPPGHIMSFHLDNGQISIEPYWTLPAPPAGEPESTEYYVGQLESLLERSIRRRLVADVPVGIMLSGGVDSSLVTALAARVSAKPVKTFTVTFPGHEEFNEGPFAKLVADYFHTEHTELLAQPASVDLLPKLAEQYDEPMADSSMVPTFLVSQQIRQHATVALGGDGGDELFGGYPGHAWVQRWAATRLGLPGPLRAVLRPMAQRLWPLGKHGRNAVLGLLANPLDSLTQINTFFDPAWRNQIAGTKTHIAKNILNAPERFKLYAQDGFDTLLGRITAMDFRTYLAEDILVKVDRASMLTSLEVRAPFLAVDIIDFAYGRLPDHLRATASQRKILLRLLGKKCLPDTLELNRKQGFSLPLGDWFKGDWGDYCFEVLRNAPPEWLNPKAVEYLIRSQGKGRNQTQRLFALTMLELWRKRYNVSIV